MKDFQCIIIYGGSIYMLALESGLAALTDYQVVRLEPCDYTAVEQIKQIKPEVAIIERNDKNSEIALEILCDNIPLIVLDQAHDSISVLTKVQIHQDEINQLSEIIQVIIKQDYSYASPIIKKPEITEANQL